MEAPHIVFVTGDHEYGGEVTIPMLGGELERRYGQRATLLMSFPDQNARENIPGLEALATADLAVCLFHRRRLPSAQVAHIETYLQTGKPVMGFRTTSHGLRYPEGDPLESWNG